MGLVIALYQNFFHRHKVLRDTALKNAESALFDNEVTFVHHTIMNYRNTVQCYFDLCCALRIQWHMYFKTLSVTFIANIWRQHCIKISRNVPHCFGGWMISLGNLDMKELFLSGREYVWVQIASKIYMCKVDGSVGFGAETNLRYLPTVMIWCDHIKTR